MKNEITKEPPLDAKIQEMEDYLSIKVTDNKRGEWAKEMEDLIIEKSPLPIFFDYSVQDFIDFKIFAYTHFFGGIKLATVSMEINTRIAEMASKCKKKSDLLKNLSLKDKYKSDLVSEGIELPKEICFLPGSNEWDKFSLEKVVEYMFYNPDIFIKYHPLTDSECKKEIENHISSDRIITTDLSADQLIRNATTVYGTTASELISKAVLLEKDIVSISNFFTKSGGTYYPINRILFNEKDKEKRLDKLSRIVSCDYSGIILPNTNNIEERIDNFFKKALEIRDQLKPISTPLLRKIYKD